MAVVPLTIVISLCLVFTFVIFFIREQSVARRQFSSAESEALLPLAEESRRVVDEVHLDSHDHDHAPGQGCGCRDGSRPPCPGCVRRGEG